MWRRVWVVGLLAAGCTREGGGAWYGRAKVDSGAVDSGDSAATTVAVELGPYSGGVTTDSARVWARLDGEGSARVAVARTPYFRGDIVYSEEATAMAEADYTVQLEVTGLDPDTTWYYQVLVDGAAVAGDPTSPSFRTLVVDTDTADFTAIVYSDQESDHMSPAYESGALELASLAFQIGDFDHRNPYDSAGLDIEGWRAQNRENLFTDRAGEALSENILVSTPFYHTWDDHDYGDNDADRTAPFRDIAMQAFREYFLTPELPNPEDGFWYSVRNGQVEFFMLDTRSQRDPNTARNTRSKSMLGATQKAWLKNALRSSTATWKIILSSSVWNFTSKPNDSWSDFDRERRELLTFFQLNRIEGIVIVSGDIHTGGGIDDGTNSEVPEMTVPTTNMAGLTCTGACGDWSEGYYDDTNRKGYALLTFSYDAGTGVHTCQLDTKDQDGNVRYTYTLER